MNHKEELKGKQVEESYSVGSEELSNPNRKREEMSNSKKKKQESSMSLSTLKKAYNESYYAYVRCIGKIWKLTHQIVTPARNSNTTNQLPQSMSLHMTLRSLICSPLCLSRTVGLIKWRSYPIWIAKPAVKKAPLTHDGFDTVYSNLKDRFENKRVLVNRQLRILFNLLLSARQMAPPLKDF